MTKRSKSGIIIHGRRQPSEKRKKPSSAKDGNERDVFSVYKEIITQPGAKVKTSADSITADLQKWAEKRVKKRDIADKMAAAGYIRRAFAMRNCGSQMAIQYCEHCGLHRIRSTNLCRDRLCPVCRWRLAIKRYAEMVQVCDIAKTEYPTNRYFFLTLTIRNCAPDDLGSTLSAMAAAWNRLLQRKIMRNAVQGWARSVEVTYNAKAGTMHPHYHILLQVPQYYDAIAINADRFAHEWQTALRLKYQPIIDLREVHEGKIGDISGAVCETFKYAVKDKDLQEMPLRDFATYVEQISGTRATAFGGTIKRIRQSLGFNDKDEPGGEDTTITCPKCGTGLQTAVFEWAAFDSTAAEKGLRDILKKAKKMPKNADISTKSAQDGRAI